MFKNNDCYQYDVKDSLQFIDEKIYFKLCKNYILYIYIVLTYSLDYFGMFNLISLQKKLPKLCDATN